MNKAIVEGGTCAWTLEKKAPKLYPSSFWTVNFPSSKNEDLEGLMDEKSVRGKVRKYIRLRREGIGNIEAEYKKGYMAFSYVWSDGTGCEQHPGIINSCLIGDFRRIAEDLDCDGIWWDAISILSDLDARRVALGKMHEIYRRVKCTLVHDHYLLDFEWAEDGSPCLAIVLSPWFSRGWTALELRLSRRVKVLFKNPIHDPRE